MLDAPWWLSVEDEDEGEPPAGEDFRICWSDWGEFIGIYCGSDDSYFLEAS